MSVPKVKKTKKKEQRQKYFSYEEVREIAAKDVSEFAVCIINAVHDEMGADAQDLKRILDTAFLYAQHQKKRLVLTPEMQEILYENTGFRLIF